MERQFPNHIAGVPTDEILRVSNAVVEKIADSDLLIVEDRRACFTTLQDLQRSGLAFPATLTAALGYSFPGPEFASNCRWFSIEKVDRTLAHPEHFCSRQSRNEELQHWAGGFVLRNIGVAGSISGFKEIEDEATFLTCLHRCDILTGNYFIDLRKQIKLLDQGQDILNKLEDFLDITALIG